MCEYKPEQSSGNATLAPSTRAPEDYKKGEVCGKEPSDACQTRFKQLKYIHDQAEKQWKNVDKDGRDKVNSVIFNVFIFCQVGPILRDRLHPSHCILLPSRYQQHSRAQPVYHLKLIP